MVEGIRVLVGEDNHVNQAVLVKTLQRLGYAPRVVVNGQEALDVVKNEAFDIVFMDCEMPVLDGLEATRRIRELPALRHVRIPHKTYQLRGAPRPITALALAHYPIAVVLDPLNQFPL